MTNFLPDFYEIRYQRTEKKVSNKRESGESRLRDIHILLMDINVFRYLFSIFLDGF